MVSEFEDDAVDVLLAQIVGGDRFPVNDFTPCFKVGAILELATLIFDKVANFGLAPFQQLADLRRGRAALFAP